LVSLALAHLGDFRLAGWLIIYAVMGDRLDGLVARRLRATSDLGVQLDSFADFLNFGIAPAFLLFSFLTSPTMSAPPFALPFGEGPARIYLCAACIIWVLAAVFRLARFNINTDDAVPTRIYFGIPTTLAGGLLVTWFLTFYKYSVPGPTFGGPKLLGESVTTPRGVWLALPAAMLVGAFLMASSLRTLKVAQTNNRLIEVGLVLCIMSGYLFGFSQLLSEYMLWMPSAWLVTFLIWGAFATEARNMQPPPLFPPARDPKP